MKVEVFEDGSVSCNEKACDKWMDIDTCCNECPIDKMFLSCSRYYVNKNKREAI